MPRPFPGRECTLYFRHPKLRYRFTFYLSLRGRLPVFILPLLGAHPLAEMEMKIAPTLNFLRALSLVFIAILFAACTKEPLTTASQVSTSGITTGTGTGTTTLPAKSPR
jgi:hypothetical protein